VVKLAITYRAKVHKKGLVVIPKELRVKYGIKEGGEVILIDNNGIIAIVPCSKLKDLYGIGKEYSSVIDEMIREISRERRIEASS